MSERDVFNKMSERDKMSERNKMSERDKMSKRAKQLSACFKPQLWAYF